MRIGTSPLRVISGLLLVGVMFAVWFSLSYLLVADGKGSASATLVKPKPVKVTSTVKGINVLLSQCWLTSLRIIRKSVSATLAIQVPKESFC